MQSSTHLRLGTACLVASLAFPAHAIYINEEAFKDAGGNVAAIDATATKAFSARRARSFQAPFDASAVSRDCSPTWIGNEGNFAWFLTAAHCLPYNNATRFAISERFELQQAVVAEGTGWAFLPPDRIGSGRSSTDIALVRLPLASPPAEWTRITRPVLYDGSDEGERQVHFVGHGNWGVGKTEVNTQPPRGLPRRLWGTSDVLGASAGDWELQAPFSPFGHSDFKARPTVGDSGGAWWQQHFGGYWAIVATTSSGSPSWSFGVRMSKRTDWITGLFPGATTLTKRLTVTESAPFVSRNHADDVDAGTVYYVVPAGQTAATGPTAGTWSGAPTHSTITVKAHDRITGNVMPIQLRGHRDTGGCGVVRMEDAAICYSEKQGPLTLRFDPADNPGLPSGSWHAKFDVEAVGWHRTYRERIPITVDVRNLTRARVTRTAPYLSPNFASHATHGTVFYLVPTQARAQGPTKAMWKPDYGQNFSTIRVTALNAVTLEERTVVLRAQRQIGCGYRTWMENAVICYGIKNGPLQVEYNAADNPGLPAGLWRGLAFVRAKGWHDPSVDEFIELEVAIDTLQ
jgi:hypothetical protein